MGDRIGRRRFEIRWAWARARAWFALPFLEMGLTSLRHALPICHKMQSPFQNSSTF